MSSLRVLGGSQHRSARQHCGRHGLYLVVAPTGTRIWVKRLVIRGRKRELGLGRIVLVSLAEAREQVVAHPQARRAGGDPPGREGRAERMPAFADAAARVVG